MKGMKEPFPNSHIPCHFVTAKLIVAIDLLPEYSI
jgi:hypothetical protein